MGFWPSAIAAVSASLVHEGLTPYMYLDKDGSVTTGRGKLLASPANAIALKDPNGNSYWTDPSTGTAATDAAVSAEWQRIKAMAYPQSAGAYNTPGTSLTLSTDGISAITQADTNSFISQLENVIPNIDSFPADAQIGVLRWAWANGVATSKYPHFISLLNQTPPDFAAIAKNKEYHWTNILPATDQEILTMFQNAANVQAQGGDVTAMNWPNTVPSVSGDPLPMGWNHRRTVADCIKLDSALRPRIRALRAAYSQARPQWEAQDIFGSERFGVDLAKLESRYQAAVTHAQKTPVHRRRGVFGSPAQSGYDRLVSAVRQAGAGGPSRPGDLQELTRRLRPVLRRHAPGFGLDLLNTAKTVGETVLEGPLAPAIAAATLAEKIPIWAGYNKSLKDCNDLMVNYSKWIPQLASQFDAFQPTWRAKDSAAVDSFYQQLYDLQTSWQSAVNAVQPMLNDSGPSDSVNAQSQFDALNAAAMKMGPLAQTLQDAKASVSSTTPPVTFSPAVQPTPSGSDSFYANTSKLDVISSLTGGQNLGGRNVNNVDWTAWLLGGAAVAVVGYIGYLGVTAYGASKITKAYIMK